MFLAGGSKIKQSIRIYLEWLAISFLFLPHQFHLKGFSLMQDN
jgi:hypothetical protein